MKEEQKSSTLRVLVQRGMSSDGTTRLGPVDGPASVNYYMIGTSATFGQDFLGDNGTIRFEPGLRVREISVFIQPDTMPETVEKFRIELHSPQGDVVLKPPTVASVRIAANDDQNGVLDLVNQNNTVLNEDRMSAFAGFTVVRSGGTYGEVSVKWELAMAHSNITDFTPTNGTVVLRSGVDKKAVELIVSIS